MKIFLVSNTSWSLWNFRLGFMETLKKKGIEVGFIAPYDEYTEKLKEKKFRFIEIKIDRTGTNIFKDLKFIFNLYKIYKNEKPDMVFHYTIKANIYGATAARFSRIKCINTISGLGYTFIKKRIYFGLVKFLYKLACRFSKRTFFQNQDDLNLFIKNKIINQNKAVLVNGSGVNTDLFNFGYCQGPKRNNDQFRFLFMGRLLRDKGIYELIEAMKIVKKKYSNSQLYLLGRIGDENPTAISKKKIEEWQNQSLIEYLGEAFDVRPFICNSDCVVLPSYREGIPRALLEASAMGKPVIATDTAGCRKVIDDDINGFLVPLKDAQKLAQAMQKIIELSEEKRIEMGKAGREKVLREFDEKKIIEEYLKEVSY